MIITIGNIKGGVGKSTIACNMAVLLAATGQSVILIDGDKQGSSAEFAAQRAENYEALPSFTCVRAVGAEVRQQVKGMQGRYDYIIIDAGAQDNPALRAGLTVSDAVLVPVPPKSIDVWALEGMADMIQEVRELVNPDIQAYAFVNMGFAQGSDNDFAKAIIQEDFPAIKLVKSAICQRKAFSDGVGVGLAVTETKPKNTKAISELMAVMEDVGILKNNIVSMLG